MDRGSVEILKENLNLVNLSMKRLLYSYENCNKTGLKDFYSDDEFDAFDALISRYARTTNMLINKVLRNIDIVEYIDGGTIIDAINNMERRGIVDANDLFKLKDLQNSITHEYVTDNIVRFFDCVLKFTPILQLIIERINDYCSRYTTDKI